MLDAELKTKLQPGPERGGVILTDGTIIEFENIAENPEEGFCPDIGELIPYVDDLASTWHTHPNSSSNLSVEDSYTFLCWPFLTHAIIGEDGIRWYKVKGRAVVNA